MSNKSSRFKHNEVAEKSCQSGGTQRNAQKGSNKKPCGKKEILHSSSNNTNLSTASSTKVVVSSIRVGKESGGSGGSQQNVSKSSKEKPHDKKEILHSSSNDTKLSTPSTKAVSSRRVGKESGGSGGAQQNVRKSSKVKPHGNKEILHSSSNDTKLSTPSSTKVAVSSRRVGKESGGSGGAQQNVQKSSKEKPHGKKEILHSSSNDTKLSTPTKVAVSSRRVGKESGGPQQNSRKSSKEKPHGKKEILHSSSNDTKLSTSSSSTKVVVSSRRVGKKSGGSCGTQQNVPKSSKKKPSGKKEILHSSCNDTKLSILSSTKVVVSSRSVVDESGGNGDTQQNVPKSSTKKRQGQKEILHASSKDTRQSTSSSTKVAVSSRSGGIQQNVSKSSKKKPRGKKEIFHSSRNDTGLSTASTKVLVSRRRVVEKSSGSGGTQQNVLKSSIKKLHNKKKIVHPSRNGTRLSKSSSIKVAFSSRRVAEESTGSGDTQENVQKSSKKKLRCKKKILHSSSNDTRPSTSSSTKVVISRRRVVEERGGNGDTQQNLPKSFKRKPRGKKKILQVSSNVTRLSTCPKKIVDSSRRRVIEKSRRSGGTQKNVRNSSKIKTRFKKVTLKQKKHYQSSSMKKLAEEENIEFLKSKYGKAICTINDLKEIPCFKQLFDLLNIPLQVMSHSGFLCRWIAPPAGWVSLNTDGALNHANASCGGLIRDNKGKVLQFYHAAVDRQAIHHIELQAIAHGLGVALEGGRGRIWVQSDSQCAIDIINGEYSPPCNSIAIVDEIKRKMEQFEEIRFSHVFREMNKPADLIAKWGVGDLSIYGHPIPKELDIMVQEDAKGAWYFRKYKGDTDEMDQ